MGISTGKTKKVTASEKKSTNAQKNEIKNKASLKKPKEIMNEVKKSMTDKVKDNSNDKFDPKNATGITTAMADDKETLNDLMDPTPAEVINAIRKGKSGEACYRLTLCKTSTVAHLKEFLAEIPDDTLVRIGGQTNGFVQMDTSYPDLNFCVPEECGEPDDAETKMTKEMIEYAGLIHDHFIGDGNNAYQKALLKACETLGLNPDAIEGLTESMAEMTTESAVQTSLYNKFMTVIGTAEAIFYNDHMELIESERCNPENCLMEDEEFAEFLEGRIRTTHEVRKILSRVEHINEKTKLSLRIRSKKKGKKCKTLTDNELMVILKEVLPENVSALKIVRRYPLSVDVEYELNCKNPFGKRPKKGEIAEVICSACDGDDCAKCCDSCDMMESCDGGSIPEMDGENESTVISAEMKTSSCPDARCVPDDEDD